MRNCRPSTYVRKRFREKSVKRIMLMRGEERGRLPGGGVLNKYFAEERDNCAIYNGAHFTANKDEYLPIPFEQISASNGHYTQNIGNW